MHTTDATWKSSPTDDKSVNGQQKTGRERHHCMTVLQQGNFFSENRFLLKNFLLPIW
jgi:hypothetical protein